MFYPLNLNNSNIYPLFGSALEGPPHIFDFSSANPKTLKYTPTDFKAFNNEIFRELQQVKRSWGVGKYLEERKNLLRDYPNIIDEKRYYHLGLDIITLYNTPIYAPLPATVYKQGKENQVGNYGGYVILRHEVRETVFYSFYGHLKTPHQVCVGQKLAAGEIFACLGKESDSGGWFTHVHLQVLTERAMDEGLDNWGYASPEWLTKIDDYFPSPYPLFAY